MSLWKTIARNTASSFAVTFVSLACNFFVTPFILQHVGMAQFGMWALAMSLVGTMGLLDVALGPALVKQSAILIARNDHTNLNSIVNSTLSIYLAIASVVVLLTWSGAGIAVSFFHVTSHDRSIFLTVLRLVGIQAALSFPISCWNGIVGGLQDQYVTSLVNILANVVKAVGSCVLLVKGYGLLSLIWLALFTSLFIWVVLVIWVRHRLPGLIIAPRGINALSAMSLLKSCGPMLLWGLAGKATLEAGRIAVGFFHPITAVAVYDVGARVANQSRTILYSTISVMPSAAGLYAQGRNTEIQDLFLRGTRYCLLAYSTAACSLFLFGSDFISLWVGSSFAASSHIITILVLAALYQSQTVIAQVILAGSHFAKQFSTINFSYALLSLGLSAALTPKWGGKGAALATLITIVAVDSIALGHLHRWFGTTLPTVIRKCHVPTILSLTPPALVLLLIGHFTSPIVGWLSLSWHVMMFLACSSIFITCFGLTNSERSAITHRLIRRKYTTA